MSQLRISVVLMSMDAVRFVEHTSEKKCVPASWSIVSFRYALGRHFVS